MASIPAPNRERVDRFTWDRHYFHDPSKLARRRSWLNWLALILAVTWLGVGWALPEDDRQYRLTHGPVSNPHAAWNMQCEACHTPSEMPSLAKFPASLFGVHERWREFRCETCHHGPVNDAKNYAPHHAAEMKQKDFGTLCARCHRDHQGSNFSLVKLPDRDCIQCHADLKEHEVKGSPVFANSISQFDKDHPEFKPVLEAKDFQKNRTLHFNHGHHLMAGIPLTEAAARDKPQGAWTLGKIDERFRERYRMPGQKDSDLVSLNCASCHQLDAGRISDAELKTRPAEEQAAWKATFGLTRELPRDAMLPPRGGGAYYLPVNYESSCQACHPISTGPVKLFDIELPSVHLPHRLVPERLNEELRQRLTSELAKVQTKKEVKGSPTSGRLDPRIEEQLQNLQRANTLVNNFADQAKKQLFVTSQTGVYGGTTCGKCHTITPDAPKGEFPVARPTTPAIWFTHAKFDHTAHRAMTCISCHPTKVAVKGEVTAQQLSQPEPVDIPGLQNCKQCHTPSQRVKINNVMQTRGGVRHDCVDCHRYHGSDGILQGPGSKLRDPPDASRLSIDELLNGLPPATQRKIP